MTTPAEPTDWQAINRANWGERVPIHVASDFYDVAGFRAGRSSLRDFEIAELGDVTGCRLLHLQCHFGLDTLSWARRGAIVAGLDFSAPAIDIARRLAAEIHAAKARFVVAGVYRAVEALAGETYDVVYTGLGALCWLPDLTRWARVVNSLLAPGGVLYVAEFHPLTDMLGDDGLTVQRDYFDGKAEVGHVLTDPRARAIVRAAIDLSHALNVTTVAEGVENAKIADWLRDRGCEVAQGMFYSPPIVAPAMMELITSPAAP